MSESNFSRIYEAATKVAQAKDAAALTTLLTVGVDDEPSGIDLALAYAIVHFSTGGGDGVTLDKGSDSGKIYRQCLRKIDYGCVKNFSKRGFKLESWIKSHKEDFKKSFSCSLFNGRSAKRFGEGVRKHLESKLHARVEGEVLQPLGQDSITLRSVWRFFRKFWGEVLQSLRQKSFRLAMVLGLLLALFGISTSGANALQPLAQIVMLCIAGFVLHSTIGGLVDVVAKSRIDNAVEEVHKFLLGIAVSTRNEVKGEFENKSRDLGRECYKAAGVAVQRDESFEAHLNEVRQAREAWAGLVTGIYARAMKERKAGSRGQVAEGGVNKRVKIRRSAARSRMRAALEGIEKTLREEFHGIDAVRFRLLVSRVRREVFSGFDIGLVGDIESSALEELISGCGEELMAKARHCLEEEISRAAVPEAGMAESVGAPDDGATEMKMSEARADLKKRLEDIEKELWGKFGETLRARGFRFVIANERYEIDAAFGLNFRDETVKRGDFDEWCKKHCEEFRVRATDSLTKRCNAEREAKEEKEKKNKEKAEKERQRLEEAAGRPPLEEGA